MNEDDAYTLGAALCYLVGFLSVPGAAEAALRFTIRLLETLA